MSDEFFDKINDYNNRPQNTEPTADDSISYNPYTQQPATPYQEPMTQPVNPFDRPSQQTVEPVTTFEPAVSEPEPRDTSYVGTYADMYRPANGSSSFTPSPAESKPDSVYSASDEGSDGYYYRSFTKHDEPGRSSGSPKKEKEKKQGLGKGAIAVLLIICILVSGAAGFGGSILASKMNLTDQSTSDSADSTKSKNSGSNKTSTASKTSTSPDLSTAEITDIAAPSVVEITTEVVQTSDFYGQYIQQGAGSGVIIKEDGTIITNNHVIEGAKEITVTLRSGESFDARLIGTDEELDIALIKIDAGDTELTVAEMGDSDTLNVGDKSVIIGNPLGTLGGSVTEGIISALDRSIVIDGKTMNLMQTDAAINAGNSGGGMFNGQGQLVGVVVAKNYSGEVDNIGFVIPINAAKSILEDLNEYGYVRGKADTGMTFVDLTNPLYTWYYFRTGTPGCYINSVESGSNAEKAGFKKGDRIISVDGEEISSSSDIKSIISDKSVGDEIKIEIDRNGQTGTLNLTLEEKIPDSARN